MSYFRIELETSYDVFMLTQTKRIVLGMREVAKNLKMSRLKAVIISPNVGKNQTKGNSCLFCCPVKIHAKMDM